MTKIIKLGNEGRQVLINGINTLADAVTSTLGPNGRNVVYIKDGEVRSTKDGVTVAKNIILSDAIENIGAEMIKQASLKTADTAGDGTTTSTLLAQEMINDGLKYVNNGVNVVEMKKGIEITVKKIIKALDQVKEEISSQNQLPQIASISSNNDLEIGNLIAESIEKVGKEGIVHIEESKSGDTYLETVEGMQFDRGYKSHFFVTDNNSMTCSLENCVVLVTDNKLTSIKDILHILENVASNNKTLLIIADDIDGEALSTMIVNKIRGSLKVCAVKAPDYGDRRKLILEDIATLTGGQVVTSDKGMKFDEFDDSWFGEARLITISKDQTTIVGGKGDVEQIKERIVNLQQQIENASSAFEKEKLQERLAKLAGGVAIIHVGGNTETEIKEKKDRVEDALYATKAALEDGIVPGGGTALIHALRLLETSTLTGDAKLGETIVKNACQQPFIKILKNAGFEESYIYSQINNIVKPWSGFNLKTETIVDMKEAGIIDPTKVTKNALMNAASVAATVLLTECVIADKPDQKEGNDLGNTNGLF
jgi:chaperonin GroEL